MTQGYSAPTTERVARQAISMSEAGAAAEDVLITWLIGLPDDADISREATQLATRLDEARTRGRAQGRLRDLLVEVAQTDSLHAGGRSRTRNRWRN